MKCGPADEVLLDQGAAEDLVSQVHLAPSCSSFVQPCSWPHASVPASSEASLEENPFLVVDLVDRLEVGLGILVADLLDEVAS